MTSVELVYKAKASLDRAIHSSGVGQAAQLQEAETYLSMAKVAASIEHLLSQPMTADEIKTIHEGRMSLYEDSGAPECGPEEPEGAPSHFVAAEDLAAGDYLTWTPEGLRLSATGKTHSGAPEWHPDRDKQRVEAMTKALLGIIKAWEEIYMEIPAYKENLGLRANMMRAINEGRKALYDHTDTPMGDML